MSPRHPVIRFLYVTSEHHRLPGQQDAARDATDIHPHDLAADGPQEARLVKSSDLVTLYRGHPLTLVYASHLEFNKAPSHVRFGSYADIASVSAMSAKCHKRTLISPSLRR